MMRETIRIDREEIRGEQQREPAPRADVRPKVGVVLGSGGIKALAGIPLFEFLRLADIKVDLLVGCSGGSIICGGIGAGFSPAEFRSLAIEILDRKLFERVDYRSILGIVSPRLGRFDRASGILKPDAIREVYQPQ